MRDAADTAAAEIPSIEPPPPAPAPRVTLQQRRELASYYPPKLAPSCRHCRHRCVKGEAPPGTYEDSWCANWDFRVQLGGICATFEAAGPKA